MYLVAPSLVLLIVLLSKNQIQAANGISSSRKECQTIETKEQWNGYSRCGHVVSMRQRVHLNQTIPDISPTSPKLTGNILPAIKRTVNGIQNAFTKKLKKDIVEIVVTSINTTNETYIYSVAYDVFSNNPTLTPSNITQAYLHRKEKRQQKSRNHSNLFRGWTNPITDGSGGCPPKVLRFNSEDFSFKYAKSNGVAQSMEECRKGEPKATVKCVRSAYSDGTSKYFHDYTSLRINPHCAKVNVIKENIDNMLASFQNQSYADLAQFASDGLSNISALSDYVSNNSLTISSSEFISVALLAENILHFAQQSIPSNRSHSNGSISLAVKLEDLASRIEGNAMANASSIYVEVKKIPENGKKSETLFPSYNSSKESEISRAVLPQEAIEQAKRDGVEANISVSFVLFKDGEFFKSPKNIDFEINEVLSVRVSGVKIKNLKTPFRYQMRRQILTRTNVSTNCST